MEAVPLAGHHALSCTGSGLSSKSSRLHFASHVVTTILGWLLSSGSTISSCFWSWDSFIKPVLNVHSFLGPRVLLVSLRLLISLVAPVAEPAKKASNGRYSNDYGQDNKNYPKWSIWMARRWLPCLGVGVNHNGLQLLLRFQRHLQAWLKEEKGWGFVLVKFCNSSPLSADKGSCFFTMKQSMGFSVRRGYAMYNWVQIYRGFQL